MLLKRQKDGHTSEGIVSKKTQLKTMSCKAYETERKTTELFVSRAQLMDPVYPQLGIKNFCLNINNYRTFEVDPLSDEEAVSKIGCFIQNRDSIMMKQPKKVKKISQNALIKTELNKQKKKAVFMVFQNLLWMTFASRQDSPKKLF